MKAGPETAVRITLDLPTEVTIEDPAWLRAVVTDSEGNQVLGAPLDWVIDSDWTDPLQVHGAEGDSVLVQGRNAGVGPVRVFLGKHPFMSADPDSGSVRVGYRNVELSFPGMGPVLHVASQRRLWIPVRAVDARGQELEVRKSVRLQVRPGRALIGSGRLVGTHEFEWDSVAPGTDTVIVDAPDCLGFCQNRLIVEVEFIPAYIGFPELGDRVSIYSLGDSVRPATLLDAEGSYIRDANPVYTLEDPADTLVLDPAALAEGTLVSRADGEVLVHARDGNATGDALVTVHQRQYQLEVLDPVARYLVGPGGEDVTRIEVQDRRGNPLVSAPERDPRFMVQEPGILEVERLGRTVAIIRAVELGESLVWTDVTRLPCSRYGCFSHTITDTVRVIPEPDSVRALPPPVNPVTALGLVADPLLGDIHLPGETLAATELVWTALDATVAIVDPWGWITALSNGTARFEGRMGASADTVTLTVSAPGS